MAKAQWPTVTNRNVAQPSRVRLVSAPESGPDTYDVTPIPGTVVSEGTLINQALFTSEKSYVDENDTPIVTTGGTGAAYTVTVPQWKNLTPVELDGKLLVVKFHVTSTTVSPTISINGGTALPIYNNGGTGPGNGAPLPSSSYLFAGMNAELKLGYSTATAANYIMISSGGSRPYGGAYAYTPWTVGVGGTGASTQVQASVNLGFESIINRVALPTGTDLNTLTSPGSYTVVSNEIARSILNTPHGAVASGAAFAFNLTCTRELNSGSYLQQSYVEYSNDVIGNNNKTWRREWQSGGGWSRWTSFDWAYGDTVATARTKLEVPLYSRSTNTVRLLPPDGVPTDWYMMMSQVGGILPYVANPTSGSSNIGASNYPFISIWSKTFNGDLASSYITGTMSVAQGGTGATTIMQGLSNLNGWTTGSRLNLAAGSNLNNVTAVGCYAVIADTIAPSILNTPSGTTRAFLLTVIDATGSGSANYRRQIFSSYYVNEQYERSTINSGSSWTPWVRTNYYAPMSTTEMGIAKVDGTSITCENGTLRVLGGGDYKLPIASASVLGGIKVGDGLTIDAATGVMKANASISLPISIVDGGTGGSSEVTARNNLGVPGCIVDQYGYLTVVEPDGTIPVYQKLSSSTGGLLPNTAVWATGASTIGTTAWVFKEVNAKTLNGSLAATSITGTLPVANGGTGGTTLATAANNLAYNALLGLIPIAADTDLNTIVTIGNYHSGGSANAATIRNTPWGAGASVNTPAFRLTVEGTLGDAFYVIQTFRQFYGASSKEWYRYYRSDAKVWTTWRQSWASGATEAEARATLGAPGCAFDGAGYMTVLKPDGTPPQYQKAGAVSGGYLPIQQSPTGASYVGTDTWSFLHVYSKNLHGSLAVSDITGTLPVTKGGTGGNTPLLACASLNALNMSTRTVITATTTPDMNDLVTPGCYATLNGQTTTAIKNMPAGINEGVRVDVSMNYNATDRIEQCVVLGTSGVRYTRVLANGAWTSWSLTFAQNTIGSLKTYAGITYTGVQSTGTDAQVKNCYKIAPYTYVVNVAITVAAKTGTNAMIQLGTFRLPFPMRSFVAGTSTIHTAELPLVAVTGKNKQAFPLSTVDSYNIELTGYLATGDKVPAQTVLTTIILVSSTM